MMKPRWSASLGGFWRVTKYNMDGSINTREWVPTNEKEPEEAVEPLAQYPETKAEVQSRVLKAVPTSP